MAKDMRTKMSKSILSRLVDFSANIQKDSDGIGLEWGWIDDNDQPRFSGFPISEGLFNELKSQGLIQLDWRDDELDIEWYKATNRAGATLYPHKAEYYGGKA